MTLPFRVGFADPTAAHTRGRAGLTFPMPPLTPEICRHSSCVTVCAAAGTRRAHRFWTPTNPSSALVFTVPFMETRCELMPRQKAMAGK